MFDTEKVKALAHAQLAGDAEAGAALCVIVDGQEVLSETWGRFGGDSDEIAAKSA